MQQPTKSRNRGELVSLTKVRAIGTIGSASLCAMLLVLAPALATGQRAPQQTRMNGPASGRPLGAFTPAVSDPRLNAMIARRPGSALGAGFSFTPSSARNEGAHRGLRVAVRTRANTPVLTSREVRPSAAAAVTALTPSSSIWASRSAGGASRFPATSPRMTAA